MDSQPWAVLAFLFLTDLRHMLSDGFIYCDRLNPFLEQKSNLIEIYLSMPDVYMRRPWAVVVFAVNSHAP